MNGFFIVIEGIDGCGSTTQCKILADRLIEKGYKVHSTAEPSGSKAGKLLREYLKDKNAPIPTDALLFAADRAEHYHNEILPKIKECFIVISDRYIESSIAYQVAQSCDDFNISVEWVLAINKFIEFPDLTIVLDVDVKQALSRKKKDEELEKFEKNDFLSKVSDVFIKRAKGNGDYIIQGSGSIEETALLVSTIVDSKLMDLKMALKK